MTENWITDHDLEKYQRWVEYYIDEGFPPSLAEEYACNEMESNHENE